MSTSSAGLAGFSLLGALLSLLLGSVGDRPDRGVTGVPSLDNLHRSTSPVTDRAQRFPSGSSCRQGSDPNPADCRGCHRAIHDEWQESLHAKAFTDPVFQEAIAELERPERCIGCHAPVQVLPRLGRPPSPRTSAREHGVWCGSCHVDRDGEIAGPFGAEHEDHPSRRHPAFRPERSEVLCGSCHDLRIGPVLPLARDFRSSGLHRAGTSCVTCHMPSVRRVVGDGGPERDGRRHRLLGPSDPEFAASAFAVSVDHDDDGNLELRIENRAGHRVPGLTTRRFRFEVRHPYGVETVEISAENPLYQGEFRRFPFPTSKRGRVRGEVQVVVTHEHLDRSAEILRQTERL